MILGPFSKLRPAKKCGHLTKKGRSFCALCTSRHKRPTITCPICGSIKAGHVSDIKKRVTCSQACYGKLVAERQRGEKSHLWLGGRSDENRLARGSAEAAHWRAEILLRDDYTCQQCRQRGGRLSADHIKPWSLYPELRYVLSNGRALCWPCHSKLETSGWRMTNKIRAMRAKGLLP